MAASRPGLDLSRVVVEPPRDAAHGDLSTNAAMVIAKPARTNPRQLADLIVADLATDPRLVDVSVAGPRLYQHDAGAGRPARGSSRGARRPLKGSGAAPSGRGGR